MKTEEIYHYVSELTEQVENGEINPLKARMIFSELEKVSKSANEKIRPLAVYECEKGVDTFEGFKVERMQSGSWDYSSSDEWNKKKNELESIQSEMKSAYKILTSGNLQPDITDEGILINDKRVIPANYNPNAPTVKFIKIK
jgi:hypothetical protein